MDNYHIDESSQIDEPEWDGFVARRGGDILQTSLWGRVKAHAGWSPVRLIARHNNEIVGGFQLLSKRVIPGARLAVVLRGPLNDDIHPGLFDLLLKKMQSLCQRRSIQFLLIQPPLLQPSPAKPVQLPDTFYRSSFEFMVLATTIVDLKPEPDALLKNMRSKTRYNIQLGLRKGIEVREGSRADIGTLHRLLQRTGERQGFDPQAVSHFEMMWDILAPAGHVKIFFAELDGDPISALLAVAFGDTVVYKRGGWSGKYGSYHPNEVLHWQVMNWAKNSGYSYYDFDGIDLSAARALLDGAVLSSENPASVTRFKLGFGGRAVILPELYEYVKNPAVRWGTVRLLPRIKRIPIVEDFLFRLDRA